MNNTIKLKNLYDPFRECSPNNPLYIEYARQFVGGYGNSESKIMFIGEAPGEEEERTGKPFQGRSGQLLRRTLDLYSLNDSNIFVTNVVKFRPPQNRTPLLTEIKEHKIILDEEIRIVCPHVIITVGAIATNALLPNNTLGITKIRGAQFKNGNITIIPLFHPAYILRNQTVLPIFEKDIDNIVRYYESL